VGKKNRTKNFRIIFVPFNIIFYTLELLYLHWLDQLSDEIPKCRIYFILLLSIQIILLIMNLFLITLILKREKLMQNYLFTQWESNYPRLHLVLWYGLGLIRPGNILLLKSNAFHWPIFASSMSMITRNRLLWADLWKIGADISFAVIQCLITLEIAQLNIISTILSAVQLVYTLVYHLYTVTREKIIGEWIQENQKKSKSQT